MLQKLDPFKELTLTPGRIIRCIIVAGIERLFCFAHHFEKLIHNFILIHVSLRNDGSESVPIILPHQEPFYLYPEHRTMKCQKVFGMQSSDQWIKYPHTQSGGGCNYYYPYDDDCRYDHKVHYCYYTRDTIISSTNVVG